MCIYMCVCVCVCVCVWCRLLREDEVKAIQWEAEEVKKERDKTTFQLRKKEWECDSLKMER